MKKRAWVTLFMVLAAAVLVNVVAWNSRSFCDFYVDYIFPVWVNTYGRLTGIWSFSVGEIMIAAGVILTAAAVLLGMFAAIFLLLVRDGGLSCRVRKICRIFYKGFAWIAAVVFVVMTLNCFVLYHCSTFGEKYLSGAVEDYTIDELILLRDHVVTKCNELSRQVERDEDGTVIYHGDMGRQAVEAMQSLGTRYEQLSGYYPRPKEIRASEFLSQQKMQGYYFPFSMEANYNSVMSIMNKPSTMCHELAHLKGFIYEDEANLIGYLACINSDDVTFQYSGYLSVLNYIDNDFYQSINKNKEIYNAHVRISPQVKKDNIFLTQEAWKKVEERKVVKTETVARAADAFVETTLVLNGVEDGKLSYCRVVGLMLQYYEGDEILAPPEEYLVGNY